MVGLSSAGGGGEECLASLQHRLGFVEIATASAIKRSSGGPRRVLRGGVNPWVRTKGMPLLAGVSLRLRRHDKCAYSDVSRCAEGPLSAHYRGSTKELGKAEGREGLDLRRLLLEVCGPYRRGILLP